MRIAFEMGRILGCLVEKQLTTPQQYPLTLNALVLACNQTSNREPVVEYAPDLVQRMIGGLRQGRMVIEVPAASGRSALRYRHTLDLLLTLDPGELAVLAVLLLRGSQTVGELRTRTERMASFPDLAAVTRVLEGLAQRDEPLVRRLERKPGQKEERWTQLLAAAPDDDTAAAAAPRTTAPALATHTYELEVRWTGNSGAGTAGYTAYSRDHEVSAPDLPAIPGSADSRFRGSPDRWNPEQMLVAALAQCHMLAYLHLAANAGVVVTAYSDRPVGTLALTGGGRGHVSEVTLRPSVTVAEPSMVGRAGGLHDQAHENCFIAQSVAFPVHCRASTLAAG